MRATVKFTAEITAEMEVLDGPMTQLFEEAKSKAVNEALTQFGQLLGETSFTITDSWVRDPLLLSTDIATDPRAAEAEAE